MRRLLPLLLGMTLMSPLAGAQSGSLDIAPVVLIILDTSGSMSYTQTELSTPLCSRDADVPSGDDPAAQYDSSVPYSFSRDMIAKEVLTGTFNDFWCRERIRPSGRFDHGYPIPWFTPEYSSQGSDGIIDVNRENIKFGVMTFDTVLSAGTDQSGGWSIGPNAQSLEGIGITNIGVMNDAALRGRLVIPPPEDDFNSIVNNNENAQHELLAAVPFGGTPISPSLEDTAWLLQQHGSLIQKTDVNDGDPYRKCRPKHILLITDGRPNLGENDLGYKTSVEAAEALFKNGYKTHVVGFNLDGSATTIVDDIAAAGGTENAEIASTPDQLSTALTAILSRATPGLYSRTDAVFTNRTDSFTDLQYQVNTAYSNALTSDIDKAGYVEVVAYRCEDGCRDEESGGAGACEVYDARENLNLLAARKMYFTLDGELQPFEHDTVDLTADVLKIPTTGTAQKLSDPNDNGGVWSNNGETWNLSDPVQREFYRQEVIDFIHGRDNTRRKSERLGAIQHSTPVIQTDLANIDVPIPSFTSYRNSIIDRPTMMYTTTHEGFLHAFHLGQPTSTTPSGTDWLEEVWAIAPQHTTERLYELTDSYQTLMDGRLVLKDIRLKRSAANISTADEAAQWRSILVVPYRQGGRGMFAVDVTDPFSPFIRWEINNERRCYLDQDDGLTKCKAFDDSDESDYRNLGYTHAKPQVGSVFINNEAGDAQEEIAAVFFPCGEGVDTEPESGKCFMVTRLSDGAKIREFKNGDTTLIDTSPVVDNVDGMEFDIVGDPSAYNTFIGTFVTRLFVGDAGGQLWRVDVSDTDPANWKMSWFFDIYHDLSTAAMTDTTRSPLKNAPAMSPLSQRGKLALVFGTGDIDYATDLSQKTVVYSVNETVDLATGNVTSDTPNWRRILNEGENLTSRPIIFGSAAYFTSYEADQSDGCKAGVGRIWGLHFTRNTGGQDPEPAFTDFDEDGEPKATKLEYIELVDTIPYGLTLVARPACVGDQGINAAANGGATSINGGNSGIQSAQSGQLELVVQTGTGGATNDASKPAKGSKTPAVKAFHQKLVQPPKQVISVSWGQIQQL